MEKNEQVHLDRSIDLFSALALVIGTVIGSGIFFKQASVLSYSHSTTLALLAWFFWRCFDFDQWVDDRRDRLANATNWWLIYLHAQSLR